MSISSAPRLWEFALGCTRNFTRRGREDGGKVSQQSVANFFSDKQAVSSSSTPNLILHSATNILGQEGKTRYNLCLATVAAITEELGRGRHGRPTDEINKTVHPRAPLLIVKPPPQKKIHYQQPK